MSKVVVITGASKGIGAATAIAFGRAGYDVVINYHKDTKNAQNVAKLINKYGQNATIIKADVFTKVGIKDLFSNIKKTYTNIDVLVNNAGHPNETEFGKYTLKTINESLMANFVGSVLCTQEAVKLMNPGCVLFTSSIYGLNFEGNPNLALYSAAKSAMINFMQTISEKLAPNIRCNAVAPGTTLTPIWDGVNPEYAQKSLDMTLQKEWVGPDEIANAFVFLVETPHINCQTIVIDGGWQKKIRENSPKR